MSDRLKVLDAFSKDEIIAWLRDQAFFLRVSRRDLLFVRWSMQSEKLERDYDAELARWDAVKPDFKKRDALAIEFNDTTDRSRRLQLLELMEPYDSALRDHIKRMQTLEKRRKAVDRTYRAFEKEAA